MKRTIFYLVLLFVLLTLSGCANEEPPYFNLPTIESEYDFRVSYFSRGMNSEGELRGGDGLWFYAHEREWLQEHPERLERRRRGNDSIPRALSRNAARIVTSVDELAMPELEKYTEYFFENYYIVVIDLTMPHSSLDDLVHRIEADGTILLRPRMAGAGGLTAVSYWTIIIELDNRFRPSEFNVVLIENPWAP
ncbi:MAG: hypothetical protein FWC92_08570 [Defluviitaleaceae bacterium]|nr:hypothetical protein [Defluviitaleaceae bacterium]